MKTGIEIISAERKRQIEVEGYDESHDDEQKGEQIAYAAACYAIPNEKRYGIHCVTYPNHFSMLFDRIWPWERKYWKPTPENRVKELAKAGALIAAEIDRLQRLKDK